MSNNPLWYLFRKTWEYSAGNRKNVTLYTVMFIIAESVDTIFSPLIAVKMIEVLTIQGINTESIGTLYICLGLILLRVMVSWAFHGPARCIERNNAFNVRVNFAKFLLKGVMTLPLKWHVDHHTGDTTDKVNKGTGALFDFSEVSFIPIRCAIQLVGSYIMLAYFFHSSAYLVLLMLLVSVWITMRFDRVLIEQYQQLDQNDNEVSESVIDAIQKISAIIVLRGEKLLFEAIIHKYQKQYELFKRNQRLNEFKWFLTSECCNLMVVIVIAAFLWEHWGAAPGAAVATFYVLTAYLDRISELFFRFTEMYSTVVRRKARVMNSEILSHDFVPENFTNHALPKDWQKLEVKNLSFVYPNTDGNGSNFAMKNVFFSLNRGEKVAFVGQKGSGKSTFLAIMSKLYDPQEITLLIDGKVVQEGFAGTYRGATLVQQESQIFATTILKNITMGAEHDLGFVRKFSDMACFTEVAENLPKKFETSMKEDGVNLSGGQQQCLALSRGLLFCHDKDIVLLDEPTSSLDMITGITVYRNIFREFRGKTIISTVHQLHLLPLFDRICVFENGRIVGSGTLQELQSNCPAFFSLWRAMQGTQTGESVNTGK